MFCELDRQDLHSCQMFCELDCHDLQSCQMFCEYIPVFVLKLVKMK